MAKFPDNSLFSSLCRKMELEKNGSQIDAEEGGGGGVA